MAFLHTLVKTESGDRIGWLPPPEMVEATPCYVSYVIPLAEHGDFFDAYDCEMIGLADGEKRVEARVLTRHGPDSFCLEIPCSKIRFTVMAGTRRERSLPNLGTLRHPDFPLRFVKIEPADTDLLDTLYIDKRMFVIGCEPTQHYEPLNEVHMLDEVTAS